MPDVESLLRQVLAGQAVQDAQLKNLENKVDKAAVAADTARDLSNRISTILEEQDIATRFTEHRQETRQVVSEIRQDFVAANVKVRHDLDGVEKKLCAEIKALEDRMKVLEDERQQRTGAKSLIEWLSKNAGWLFAGVAAFVAGLGLKDGAP